MSSQRSEITQLAISVVLASVVVLCAALALMLGTDAYARDRYRCFPADGGASYTSPGTCRSNTVAREPLTEQEQEDAEASVRRGRPHTRCTAADGSYSKFFSENKECPSATDTRTIEYAKQPIQRAREGAPPPETATPSLSPRAPIASPSAAQPPAPSMSPARSGTGWFAMLVPLALVGLGIWGIFKWIEQRINRSNASAREEREARAQAIAQRRNQAAPDTAMPRVQPALPLIALTVKTALAGATTFTSNDLQAPAPKPARSKVPPVDISIRCSHP